ncbi:MAG: hypothetical protein CML39_09275 [Rhodobacteraceae bacterium]|nr:MAG: hypothetical protein CML39_09275 [Paracoccaceae bacterium]
MEIEFHGVRGSIPIPSENFLEYGGNTTCIEISSKDFQLIIDAGSGFKNVKISDEKPTFLIFSHFHHDHLQGLPFNEALFSTKNQIHVGSGLVGKEGLEEALSTAFTPPLFPLDLIGGNLAFNVMNFETFQAAAIDFFSIKTFPLSHPGGAAGYKITVGNRSIVCGLDHEYGLDKKLDAYFQGASDNSNLVIWDGMFTNSEHKDKQGWGHSTIEQAIAFSSTCNPNLLFITHHSPQRKDQELNQLARDLLPGRVKFAKENTKFEIS